LAGRQACQSEDHNENMPEGKGESLMLACVADESATAAILHEALLGLFPGATVTRVDTGAERTLPGLIHCAVIDATVRGEDGVEVLRRLRARGYPGAAVLMIDPTRPAPEEHARTADRMGARYCPLDDQFAASLGRAVADALRVVDNGSDESPSSRAVRALRHNQRLIAAGELAMRLQHSLNNPLAALLAEAQLLELEELAPDHEASVQRIIELTRRVVEVVRGLDGVGRA
jgi:signal transduction histidine kinase